MTLIRRQYETADDYWRVREFFRSLRAADPQARGIWDVCAFDYWRWHTLENVWERSPGELRYWETPNGQVTAVLAYGDPGVCHPMADPKTVTRDLLYEMLGIAESEFLKELDDGRTALFPWADQDDALLNSVLEERGYVHHSSGHATEYHGWACLRDAPNPVEVPAGYRLRSMGDVDEHPARSLASWRVFHPGEPDEGADPEGAWYRNIQRAPLYRRDLDVVAVAEESGDIVAFSTCYYDDVLRTGNLLLVGAIPSQLQEDLERAVIVETLARLHHIGAVGTYMSWYESDPGSVYESAGFHVQTVSRVWRKSF